MSKYAEAKTNIKDPECLIKALADNGYAVVEDHTGNPQNLVDYCGHHTQYLQPGVDDTADIIIRRRYVPGASNDIGYKKQADGTYSAIISQYDSSRHGAKWQNGVKVSYQKHNIQKAAARTGQRVIQTGKKLANGNLQYIFAKG